MTSLFPPLQDERRRIIDRLPGLIDEVFPLPARFRAGLRRDVAELSRLLTAGREDRGASYLGRPALLSAYLRYFLPWNIYRLCRFLSCLPLDLKSHDAVNDLGAGPLTFAAALWISRPDLRKLPLEFRCVDRTAAVLEAGKKFFAALVCETAAVKAADVADVGRDGGPGCPWIIKTIRGELRTAYRKSGGAERPGSLSVEIKGKPAALSAAVNVYNELFWDFSPMDAEGIGSFAERQARLLSSITESSGSILVVEPGIPRSGEFVSLLRSGLMGEGRPPLFPCAHSGPCPLASVLGPGRSAPSLKAGSKTGKAKWCHFAFDTEDAPQALHKLSAAAGIPKERAVLSFILAGPVSQKVQGQSPGQKESFPVKTKPKPPVKIRVISDSFPVGNEWGRYGCSECGLVLVTGNKMSLDDSPSGALEELPLVDGLKDAKSGAFIARKN